MIAKIAGTWMLLSGGGYALFCYQKSTRQQEKKLQELIDALETIAAEIRWKHRRLPDIFARLSDGKYYGECFGNVCENLKRHIPLQKSFPAAFRNSEPEQRLVLEGISFEGDETKIVSGLLYAAECFREQLRAYRARKKEKTKIVTAIVCCVTGFAVILLI